VIAVSDEHAGFLDKPRLRGLSHAVAFVVAVPLGIVLILEANTSLHGRRARLLLRRPDPHPAVFGFHEVFHLLV
jgi:hypothetical protein